MSDKISGLYQRILSSFVGAIVTMLFVGLIVWAFWAGFAYDFSCFGQSSCDNAVPYATILFPFGVIVLGVWLWRKRKQYHEVRYRESVRRDVVQELGQSTLAPSEQLRQNVLELLGSYESLSLDELMAKTDAGKEEILMLTRELLAEKVVRQTTRVGQGAYFSLK